VSAAAVAAGLGAAPALAQTDITYNVDQTVKSGSVVGQIVTDGALGVLTKSDIVSWDLTVTGAGASTVLTSVGGQSGVLLVGADVTATSKYIYFNYSGTDGGYILFQASNPGFYSGQKYWCNNTTWYGCSAGASVVPQGSTAPSAIYATSFTGLQILGTAAPSVPNYALFLSIIELAEARTAQMLVNQLESQLLLGLNEQISCSNCGGADANFGSAALSSHGRYALTKEWTLFGGADIGQYKQRGADVPLNVGFAAALQYDPAGFGPSRPYAVAGLTAAYQTQRYQRSYANGSVTETGSGSTQGGDFSGYAQVGWVDRVTPRDEAAAYVGYARTWQVVGAYAEGSGAANPFNATVPGGTDTLDTASLNGQYTHLFGRYIEADVNAGVDWAFNSHSGLRADIGDMQIGGAQPSFVYYQVGGRLGLRMSRRLTFDVFINGLLAPNAVGSSAHGGFGARWVF
jgi:hypothetical protein